MESSDNGPDSCSATDSGDSNYWDPEANQEAKMLQWVIDPELPVCPEEERKTRLARKPKKARKAEKARKAREATKAEEYETKR